MKGLASLTIKVLLAVLTLAALNFEILAQEGTLTCESNDGRYRYCRVDTKNRVRLTRQLSRADCRQGRSWGFDRRGIWVNRGCRAEFEYGESSGSGKAAAITAGVAGAAVLAAVIAARRSKDKDYEDMNSTQRSSYDRGYDLGSNDRRYGYDKQFSRHSDEYDRSYESYFKKGYEKGYEDDRSDNDYDADRDENRYETPNWAVGTFRGYNPKFRAAVELRVFPDGEVRGKNLVSGLAIDGYYRRDRIRAGIYQFIVRRVGDGISLAEVTDPSNFVVYRRVN